MANGPDLRIGHAERDAAAAYLRESYAEGRLTLEEYQQRLDAAFAATTQRDLDALMTDLPRPGAGSASGPPAPSVTAASGGGRERARQDFRSGARVRLGFIPVIIAALGTWLLIVDLHLRAFPWPGKLAIFVAILAVVRGLLRRVLGGRGGRVFGCGGPRGRGRARRR